MKILTYSPKVEAYVAVTQKDGTIKYYDLSQDITSVNVTRNIDEASTFSMKLQNKNGKYNNVFTPMDRIIIYAIGAPQNGENRRYPLLAGYIKRCSKFTLYQEDFSIEGRDSLYRLQEYFWDPGLFESQELFINPDLYIKALDGGGAQALVNVLTNVVGMQAEDILIGDLPTQVIDFAHELYKAEKEDDGLTREQLQSFYDILKSSSPKADGSSNGNSGSTTLPGGGDKKIQTAVDWAIAIANDNSHGYSRANRWGNPDYDCSSFVISAYDYAGFGVKAAGANSTHDMRAAFEKCGFKWHAGEAGNDPSNLQAGDVLLNPATHTELYIGNGQEVGAHSSRGNPQGGDQTGTEISIIPYHGGWEGFLRYEG